MVNQVLQIELQSQQQLFQLQLDQGVHTHQQITPQQMVVLQVFQQLLLQVEEEHGQVQDHHLEVQEVVLIILVLIVVKVEMEMIQLQVLLKVKTEEIVLVQVLLLVVVAEQVV